MKHRAVKCNAQGSQVFFVKWGWTQAVWLRLCCFQQQPGLSTYYALETTLNNLFIVLNIFLQPHEKVPSFLHIWKLRLKACQGNTTSGKWQRSDWNTGLWNVQGLLGDRGLQPFHCLYNHLSTAVCQDYNLQTSS